MMPAIPVEIAGLARKHWPIIVGEPLLIMHRENSVFRVETTRGPAALRLHRQHYHSEAALESELAWMAMLAANGIKVPVPHATTRGKFLVNLSNEKTERMADLLTWLDGSPLGRTNEPLSHDATIFYDIGATLARLHNLSDRWSLPQGFSRPHWNFDGLVGDAPFWGCFWDISGITTGDSELLLRIREHCRRDLSALMKEGLSYGLIHADLVRENIMIAGTDVSFIDFDDCGFGFRMFDIATALLKNRNEPAYEAMEKNLFAGYESECQLAQHEKAALPLFLVLRSLTYLGWAEARRGEHGIEARRERLLVEALSLSRNYLSIRLGQV